MAIDPSLWSDLQATFKEDIRATGQLEDVLVHERAALEHRDYRSFQDLLQQKQSLLGLLERHAGARQQRLHQAGFRDERSTLQAAENEAPQLAQTWHELGAQWRHCQELNAVNERIAQRTRLVVSHMLDMLRGRHQQGNIYTQNGGTRSTSSGQSITSA